MEGRGLKESPVQPRFLSGLVDPLSDCDGPNENTAGQQAVLGIRIERRL